jgi:hypothetical protein
MARWRDQWDRLNRAYSLVQQSSMGYRNDRHNSDYYRDEFAFFKTCLHMRDWLWNDPTVGPTQEDAGKLYNAHDCLKLAHDIAIGSKHVVIERPRVDQALASWARTSGSCSARGRASYGASRQMGRFMTATDWPRNASRPGSRSSSNRSCSNGRGRISILQEVRSVRRGALILVLLVIILLATLIIVNLGLQAGAPPSP